MLTIDNLKAEVKGYSLDILSEGNDSVVEGCLDTSRVWIKARLAASGIVYDPALEETDEVVKRIVLSYALYRLYSYAEQESVAHDKKTDAVELMSAYLDADAGKDPTTRAGKPTGAIAKPKRRVRL